jgi:hypothetical protein
MQTQKGTSKTDNPETYQTAVRKNIYVNKMKEQEILLSEQVSKSNQKIVETKIILIHLIHIYMTAYSRGYVLASQ